MNRPLFTSKNLVKTYGSRDVEGQRPTPARVLLRNQENVDAD
jgi:hypothetical protein